MYTEEDIKSLGVTLHHMRSRPGMYFSTPEQAFDFLRGFLAATDSWLGLPSDMRVRATVTTERGWDPGFIYPYVEMRKKGMDDKAIIDEMLAIEIEIWKRLYRDLGQEPAPSDDQGPDA